MEYTQEITLDLDSNTAYTTVGAKQGDSDSRIIKVHLTQHGEEYRIEEGAFAYFRFRKPDGKAIINRARVENNTVYIVLTAQTLAVAGRGYADITLQSGTTILSSVSFIVIIMASPQVADQAISGNEFGYLNAVVADATNITYEAEAWAKGTRGGAPVTDSNKFEESFDSETIGSIEVTQSTFMQKVGSNPGLSRTYTFTFTENRNWQLKSRIVNGTTISESDPELISDLSSYGISISEGLGPEPGDYIQVVVEEPDNTYKQNAKYYAENAQISKESIDNLLIETESVSTGEEPSVASKEKVPDIEVEEKEGSFEIQIDGDVGKDKFINKVGADSYGKYKFYYNNDEWKINQRVVDLDDYGIQITGDPNNNDYFVIYYNYHTKFTLKVAKGDTGDVNLLTFDLVLNSEDNDNGCLIMYTPEKMEPNIEFTIEDNRLYYEIMPRQAEG